MSSRSWLLTGISNSFQKQYVPKISCTICYISNPGSSPWVIDLHLQYQNVESQFKRMFWLYFSRLLIRRSLEPNKTIFPKHKGSCGNDSYLQIAVLVFISHKFGRQTRTKAKSSEYFRLLYSGYVLLNYLFIQTLHFAS